MRGFPDPAYGIGRFLEVLLTDTATGKIEVINTGMTGVNSHVVRAIAEECAKYQPDYFLVYCGNNEVICTANKHETYYRKKTRKQFDGYSTMAGSLR